MTPTFTHLDQPIQNTMRTCESQVKINKKLTKSRMNSRSHAHCKRIAKNIKQSVKTRNTSRTNENNATTSKIFAS
jgi:hypothetical protein